MVCGGLWRLPLYNNVPNVDKTIVFVFGMMYFHCWNVINFFFILTIKMSICLKKNIKRPTTNCLFLFSARKRFVTSLSGGGKK